MSTISRRLPRTISGRLTALTAAKTKKDNPGPAGNILTANTTTRLDNIYTNFKQKYDDAAAAAAKLYTNTPLKDVAVAEIKMFSSHFFQVFNLGVARKVYIAGHRSFYNLDAGSDALPPLVSEAEIMLAAQNIIDGDAQRIVAGGAAMANPTAAQVLAKRNTANTLLTGQSNYKDALDVEQELLEGHFEEADGVIKKVWDEVETFYNEEPDASRRNNAAQWGVIYITIGGPTAISGKILNTLNQPVAGATILIVESDSETTTDANGDFKITTTFIGNTVLRISAPNYVQQEKSITIVEGSDMVVNVVLVGV